MKFLKLFPLFFYVFKAGYSDFFLSILFVIFGVVNSVMTIQLSRKKKQKIKIAE